MGLTESSKGIPDPFQYFFMTVLGLRKEAYSYRIKKRFHFDRFYVFRISRRCPTVLKASFIRPRQGEIQLWKTREKEENWNTQHLQEKNLLDCYVLDF